MVPPHRGGEARGAAVDRQGGDPEGRDPRRRHDGGGAGLAEGEWGKYPATLPEGPRAASQPSMRFPSATTVSPLWMQPTSVFVVFSPFKARQAFSRVSTWNSVAISFEEPRPIKPKFGSAPLLMISSTMI